MGIVISPDYRRLFVSTGRGNSVVVIDTRTRGIIATIPVGSRAWGIGMTTDGRKLYVANAGRKGPTDREGHYERRTQ